MRFDTLLGDYAIPFIKTVDATIAKLNIFLG